MIEAGTVQNGLKLTSTTLEFKQRRLTVDLADAGGVAGVDDAALHRLDESGGDVGDHVLVAETADEGAQAAHVDLELADAHLGRHVHGRRPSGPSRCPWS